MPLNRRGAWLPREPAWGEPPQSFVTGSLGLAEQLLKYAEMFANEGDLSAACSRARCALEGLEALPARPFADGALGALLERARRELDLYEARWAKWRQEHREGRQSGVIVRERLALEDAELRANDLTTASRTGAPRGAPRGGRPAARRPVRSLARPRGRPSLGEPDVDALLVRPAPPVDAEGLLVAVRARS